MTTRSNEEEVPTLPEAAMEASEIDLGKLAFAVSLKRGRNSFRAAAAEVPGVGYNTLMGIEKGEAPSLNVYIRLCRWLNVSADFFVKEVVA